MKTQNKKLDRWIKLNEHNNNKEFDESWSQVIQSVSLSPLPQFNPTLQLAKRLHMNAFEFTTGSLIHYIFESELTLDC